MSRIGPEVNRLGMESEFPSVMDSDKFRGLNLR